MAISESYLARIISECIKKCFEEYNYNKLIKPEAPAKGTFYHVSNPIHKGSGKDLLNENIEMKRNGEHLVFYDNGNEIGGLIFNVGYKDAIESEYADSIYDFSPSVFRVFDDMSKLINIEDVWVNKNFQGMGYFRQILSAAMEQLKSMGKQFVLRAHSDNGFDNYKLVKIYSEFGFKVLQETEEDGIIMGAIY